MDDLIYQLYLFRKYFLNNVFNADARRSWVLSSHAVGSMAYLVGPIRYNALYKLISIGLTYYDKILYPLIVSFRKNIDFTRIRKNMRYHNAD